MYEGKAISIELNQNKEHDYLYAVASFVFCMSFLALLVVGVVDFSSYTEHLATTAQYMR